MKITITSWKESHNQTGQRTKGKKPKNFYALQNTKKSIYEISGTKQGKKFSMKCKIQKPIYEIATNKQNIFHRRILPRIQNNKTYTKISKELHE